MNPRRATILADVAQRDEKCVEERPMFLRRHLNWGGEMPVAMAALAPGAHDLLAAVPDDAGTRNGTTHGGRRLSVSLQVTSSDSAAGKEDPNAVREFEPHHSGAGFMSVAFPMSRPGRVDDEPR